MKKNRTAKLQIVKIFFLLMIVTLYFFCSPTSVEDSSPDDTHIVRAGMYCNELAGSEYVPVELDKKLCAARDSSGTLYVVDKHESDYRLFISRNDTLYRRKVTGIGITGERAYYISFNDGWELLFINDAGIWSNVHLCFNRSVGEDPLRKVSAISEEADTFPEWNSSKKGTLIRVVDTAGSYSYPLAVTDVGTVQNYVLRNFPPTTHFEYCAQVENDKYLLVTRPEYDWNGECVVHYGDAGMMQSCEPVDFLRATDGGSTRIRFNIGTSEAEAFFGVKLDESGIQPGKRYFLLDGDTLDIELIPPTEEKFVELGFDCVFEEE